MIVRTLLIGLGILMALNGAMAQDDERDLPSIAELEAEAQVLTGDTTVVTPASTTSSASDFSRRAHTNMRLCIPRRGGRRLPAGENPFSIRRVYGLPPIGGRGTIAIVSAFHWPTALDDFNTFARMFRLPRERSNDAFASTNKVFQVVNARGATPAVDPGWALESAIDTEWAHAMAPGAKIVLVQASSNSFVDLFQAVDVARNLPGVKQVSMSWGGAEFSQQTIFEPLFDKPGVLFFAGAGDTGGQTAYPSTSPQVIACGGTRINRTARGRFISETGWSSGGGGQSVFFSIPSYQASRSEVVAKVGAARGTPDLSFNADPATGVAVFDSTPVNGQSGWMTAGGTSVASPSLAGIVNLSHHWTRRAETTTTDELTLIYRNLGNRFAFRDILVGAAGSFSCTPSWDFVTGVGSSIGVFGK